MISILYIPFILFCAVEFFTTHEAILNVRESCKSANVKVLQLSGFLIGCLIVNQHSILFLFRKSKKNKESTEIKHEE